MAACEEDSMRAGKILSVGALALVSSACSVFGVRSEESPMYEVVRKSEDKEIRKYAGYVVATTTVSGDYREAQSRGFRILADYIFGGNEAADSIAMTAPVMQSREGDGSQIAMTAPVMQAQTEQGWKMSFMMPSSYDLKDLPKPRSPLVTLEQVPERYMAAIRYSWGRGEARNNAKGRELLEWLENESTYWPAGKMVTAGYDPPWTLPFVRRNEVLIEVRQKEGDR
jgi:hypothetical protein